jgi:biopolymer transport protein ExbD
MRRHHYRRRSVGEQAELDMTTFLNLMVVLVPFLLITAVFSRITVVELTLPTANAGGAAPVEPAVRIEVIVRNDGLEVADGDALVARIPKVDDLYDLRSLSEAVMALKRQHPAHDDASVLLEPDIEYDHLIQVMDAVRSAEVPGEGESEMQRIALFTDISIGDAP